MNDMLRNTVRFMLASMILLVLLILSFLSGFLSSYLLTTSGTLPEPEQPTPAPVSTEVPVPTPQTEDERTFQVFWEAWDLVQRNFYGEVPDLQQVTYAAIRGMLSTLNDEYTSFIEPDVAAILAEDATGEFQGIGAWIGVDADGQLEISGVFEDGPAEEAGLLSGDRILAVDGVSVEGWSVYEAIGLIRGPEGTQVTLLIERADTPTPFEVTITRARLEVPLTESELLEDDLAYIRLYDFSATVVSERFEEDLDELMSQGARAVILDLRANPGGQVDQAVEIADLFLRDGDIVIERWGDGSERRLDADPGDLGEDIPLVVLVDRNTASASEILAGALQDQERAILIGERTFGKGVVQVVLTLSDGSELWVTAAQWFTPNDRAISEQGLLPDIEVPWPEETLDPDEDPQLQRAIEYLLTGE